MKKLFWRLLCCVLALCLLAAACAAPTTPVTRDEEDEERAEQRDTKTDDADTEPNGTAAEAPAAPSESPAESKPASGTTAPAAEAPAATPATRPLGDPILSSFTATDLDGNEVDESILEDYDLIMVNIWATFCGPCINEMPELGELASEYADRGLRIVGLVIDTQNADGSFNADQLSLAADIVAETGADYLHILPSDELYDLLSTVSAVPTTYFVDSQGCQVGEAYVGSMRKSDWAGVFDELLAEVGA